MGVMGREFWVETNLENCVDILDSKRVPLNSEERQIIKGEIPYYGATGVVDSISKYLFDEELLLLGEDGAPFFDKSKAVSFLISGKSWVNNHAHVLRANGTSSNSFIMHFFNQFDFHEVVNGTTRLKLTQEKMRTIPVSLPPLNEQKRIVARLDKIMPRIDAVKERLDKVLVILKHFHQSVLAAACSGRLTEKWRVSRSFADQYDSSSNHPDDLPCGWSITTLEEVASKEPRSIQSGPFGSHLHHAEFQETGILSIGIDNVSGRGFSLGKQHRISEEKFRELSKFKARPLDVLITVMATVGRCCVVPPDVEKAIITKHVYRITVDQLLIDPYFLCNILRGDPSTRDQIAEQIRGQTRPGINGQILKSLHFALPSLPEQHEIVRQVDKLFALADRLESHYQKAKAKVDKLSQSVLAKAFRGELVITEADLAEKEGRDFESAEKLLERILEEKAKLVGSRQRTVGGVRSARGSKGKQKETGGRNK